MTEYGFNPNKLFRQARFALQCLKWCCEAFGGGHILEGTL